MKIFKKIAAGLLAAIMVVACIPINAIPVQVNAAEGNSLRLWYDEPASQGTNILSAGDWQTGYEASVGPAALAVDNNPNTLWHSY